MLIITLVYAKTLLLYFGFFDYVDAQQLFSHGYKHSDCSYANSLIWVHIGCYKGYQSALVDK